MPRPEFEPLPYLTKRGRKIFYNIVRHIQEAGLIMAIDVMELSMLSNSFDLYERAAQKCNSISEGGAQGYEGEVKPGAQGPLAVHYQVMKYEYANILKHSPKFGLTPGDREKIFSGMKKVKKVSVTEGLD